MKPLPIDERRIGKLAEECDRLDDARAPKAERDAAYAALARALDTALSNAKRMRA